MRGHVAAPKRKTRTRRATTGNERNRTPETLQKMTPPDHPSSGRRLPARSSTRAVVGLLVLAGLALLVLAAGKEKRRPLGNAEFEVDGDPVVRLLPPDAIPAIDHPDMISAAQADKIMKDDEPVLGLFDGKNARAYPTWFLDHHEIVNDRIGDVPIAATW